MSEKSGLILVNLGSPDAPTPKAVRKYLFEFLHDKRVIDTSRWIWCPILHGVILRVRPARSARNYRKIWHEFGGQNGSEAPLVRVTRRQTKMVAEILGAEVVVETAMRYGNPSMGHALDRLRDQGIKQIAVLPLYPQYAGATTASVYDGVDKALRKRHDVPSLRFLRDYHDHEDYISILAASINEHIAGLKWQPQTILASFHGMPQSYIDKGDPYADECERTTELLRHKLEMNEKGLRLTFQSRFGPKQWLQPYTEAVLQDLPAQGITRVAVVTPGFAADCLETLEEIDMEARETFMAAGGENFTLIPCLNDRPDHAEFLANLAKNELLSGWL